VSDSHVTAPQLSRLIDGDLALAERAAVLDHIGHCPACAAEQARLVDVSAALQGVPGTCWTSEQTAAVLARLPSDAPPRPGSASRRRGELVGMLLAAATLALVAVFVVAVPVGPVVASALWPAFAWLPPIGATSAFGAGAALVAISVLAPLLAYPLARWR
jgi:anti-sigma factor RsiW